MDNYTPMEIVRQLDRYIIGQDKAKKSVAVALRNRYRRSQLDEKLREDIFPKNIIMIGPTGVGKTEIARRLAKLVDAPFVKVEATKFTEVGYVGRDVEAIIRDLVEAAVRMTKNRKMQNVKEKAAQAAENRILDILLPVKRKRTVSPIGIFFNSEEEPDEQSQDELKNVEANEESMANTREKFRQKLREGKLEKYQIEIEVENSRYPGMGFIPGLGNEDMMIQIQDMFGSIFPKKKKRKKISIAEARRIIEQEEAQKMIDMDEVIEEAIEAVEQRGIVFLDEIDKIAGKELGSGPDVSREGVQRDILPIIEGTTVVTKYGPVKTDYILFIAAGAFHVSKISDLIPELQGRFPIRVELESLTQDNFKEILTQPENAIIKQQIELMRVEGVELVFKEDAIDEIARLAYIMNQTRENIGARRLHTIMEKLVEDISFRAEEMRGQKIIVDADFVRSNLKDLVKEEDLHKFIL